LNGRAILYLQEGNLDKAVDLFVAATKADPSNPTPVVNLGDASVALGDAVNAIRYYDMALQIDPNNDHAAIQLAELHAAAGPQFADKAISYVDPILKREPKNYAAMAAMGRALGAKGQWLRAIDYLYDAAQGMPKDVPVRYSLGMALLNTAQYNAAADVFLDALDLNDSDPRLHLQLGIAYYMGKNPDLRPYASKEFQHCLDRNPAAGDKAIAYYHMALVQDDAGKLDDALKLYGNALKYDPKHVGALNNTGLILAQQGKFTDAIPYYQRALKVDPNFVPAQFNLGFAFLRTGKKQDAKTTWDKLMTLPDSDPFKTQAKQLLQGAN
jgi:tetratricopeptide (TPR) repeat protein